MSARQSTALASGAGPQDAIKSGLGLAFLVGAAVMAATFAASLLIRSCKREKGS